MVRERQEEEGGVADSSEEEKEEEESGRMAARINNLTIDMAGMEEEAVERFASVLEMGV